MNKAMGYIPIILFVLLRIGGIIGDNIRYYMETGLIKIKNLLISTKKRKQMKYKILIGVSILALLFLVGCDALANDTECDDLQEEIYNYKSALSQMDAEWSYCETNLQNYKELLEEQEESHDGAMEWMASQMVEQWHEWNNYTNSSCVCS